MFLRFLTSFFLPLIWMWHHMHVLSTVHLFCILLDLDLSCMPSWCVQPLTNVLKFHSLLQLHLIPCYCAILCSTIFIFVLALVGVFYPYNRGALFTALVVIYALTSGIAGYTATSFYCQLEGTNWVYMLIFSHLRITC